MLEPRIEEVRQRLARYPPLRDPIPAGTARASVALLVRPEPEDLEILLIRRTTRADDPWSGHMALPGGRYEARDANDLETAMRETREEVGIDLRAVGMLIGELDRTRPRSGTPRIMISPFVFAVPPGTQSTLSAEVDLTVWIPLHQLLLPGAATEYLHRIAAGEDRRFPAFRYQGHTIWGMTHRILSRFLSLAAPSSRGRLADEGQVRPAVPPDPRDSTR